MLRLLPGRSTVKLNSELFYPLPLLFEIEFELLGFFGSFADASDLESLAIIDKLPVFLCDDTGEFGEVNSADR